MQENGKPLKKGHGEKKISNTNFIDILKIFEKLINVANLKGLTSHLQPDNSTFSILSNRSCCPLIWSTNLSSSISVTSIRGIKKELVTLEMKRL